jgi:hypothetical protein
MMDEFSQTARIRLGNGQRVRTTKAYPDFFGEISQAMAECRWAFDNLPETEQEAHCKPILAKAGIAFQRQRKLEEKYGDQAAEILPYTIAGVFGISRWGATLTPTQSRRFMEHINARFGITSRWVAKTFCMNLSAVRAWSSDRSRSRNLMEEQMALGILAAICKVNKLDYKEVKREFVELIS